jgi:hypothetical protein
LGGARCVSFSAWSWARLGAAYLHETGRVKMGPPQAFVNWDAVFSMVGR